MINGSNRAVAEYEIINGKVRQRLEGASGFDHNPVSCRWFAMCENLATGLTAHPAIGSVPTCNRCQRFATGAQRSTDHFQ